MAQYDFLKAQCKENDILFFRLGDFYEMFDTDAKLVSRLLNLTLTHRQDRPMCGIPYHAAKVYIARLLRLGKKIVIAEQIGVSQKGKGITERKIIETITPGTVSDEEYLDGAKNNFLCALSFVNEKFSFAYIDASTGDFSATSWNEADCANELAKELLRLQPRELLASENVKKNERVQNLLSTNSALSLSYFPDWHFSISNGTQKLREQFKVASLQGFGLNENSVEIASASFLLDYLEKTTASPLSHIETIHVYGETDFLRIDDSSFRNLEILSNQKDGSADYTLFECVNFARTAMGNRLVRSRLSFPLADEKKIRSRQNDISLFVSNKQLLKNTQATLEKILDVERLASRISMERAHAKEMQALRKSLIYWKEMQSLLCEKDFSLMDFSTAQNIIDEISVALLDEPSTVLTEGKIIREGYSNELDELKKIHDNFDAVLQEYEKEEREKTGIANLKIKYTAAFGYFIEITRGKLSSVPPHFIMRRALVNGDRYTTEKLQALEKKLVDSNVQIVELERDLFVALRKKIATFVPYLMQASHEIAYADASCAFAEAAITYHWTAPLIDNSRMIEIENARHPVVEKHLGAGEFVPNDVFLSADENENTIASSNNFFSNESAREKNKTQSEKILNEVSQSSETYANENLQSNENQSSENHASENLQSHENANEVSQSNENQSKKNSEAKRFALITGPNMAGKSTYLRQTALIVLLAQTGSFVPATKAHIGVVDKIFCRVGASDNLARGESTFLVEMMESAYILRNATRASLVIMDEVGRGTSTEDGLAIAWAVSEYLLDDLQSKTLFATHYHELTRMEHGALLKLCMDVSEENGTVVFLRKVKKGSAENSYGVHVARLAGVPKKVVQRADEILRHIQKTAEDTPVLETISQVQKTPTLFSDEEMILNEILSCNIDELTPLDALKKLATWKKELSGN